MVLLNVVIKGVTGLSCYFITMLYIVCKQINLGTYDAKTNTSAFYHFSEQNKKKPYKQASLNNNEKKKKKKDTIALVFSDHLDIYNSF